MAQGDVTAFEQFSVDALEKLHNLETDTIKMGIITNVVTPTAADATPAWGATSGVDYDGNEVTPGGNYATGGPTIANPSVTLVSGDATFDGDNVSITQHASNPTNAYWGIIYNDTATNKNAIAFVELAGPIDLSAGDFATNWAGTGIARLGAGTLT